MRIANLKHIAYLFINLFFYVGAPVHIPINSINFILIKCVVKMYVCYLPTRIDSTHVPSAHYGSTSLSLSHFSSRSSLLDFFNNASSISIFLVVGESNVCMDNAKLLEESCWSC